MDSGASSPRTTRISIGKAIGSARRSIVSSTRRSASGPCSRGIAYSISVKRTSRRVAYTRWLRSTFTDAPMPLISVRFSFGIARGSRPVTAPSTASAPFSTSRSCTTSTFTLPGSGSRSLRVDVRVSATSVHGNTYSSKWSAPSAWPSKSSSTGPSGIGASRRSSVKIGTARSVTALMAPSAPRPTRAAPSRSGSSAPISSTSPLAVTSRMASTCEEMLR